MVVLEYCKQLLIQVIPWLKEWGDLLLSALAFLLSIISMLKASKAEKLQNKINELELRIKQHEVKKIAEEQKAAMFSCVEARVISIGQGNHRLKVWNSGNTTVYNVTAKFDGDPKIIIMDKDKQPFDQLEQKKGYELSLITHGGSASKFRIITEWTNENGEQCSKMQMGDL